MKTLLILRHAKSSWADDDQDDHERPLNQRGKRAAPRMGQLIKEQSLIPDRILSSTAVRARATAAAVAKACGFQGDLELTRDLYLADPQSYMDVLALLDHGDRVMVVGHNPGMEELVAALTGEEERFPTAALAHVELPIDAWAEVNLLVKGKLIHLWRPRALD